MHPLAVEGGEIPGTCSVSKGNPRHLYTKSDKCAQQKQKSALLKRPRNDLKFSGLIKKIMSLTFPGDIDLPVIAFSLI